MTSPARVALIMTGGTIGSIGRDRLDLAWYIDSGQWLGPGELQAQVPELATVAQVREAPFMRVASHALVDQDWLNLARTVQGLFDRDEADGVVITHGTNTLEETAYFLHLTLRTDRPVVLVGAMRPSNALSADGALNLFQAVKVAADPASRGRGCLVVMNDTVFSARDVTKTSTSRVHAFQARDMGPLGYADSDGRLVYGHHSERRHTLQSAFDLAGVELLPRVDIVMSYVGADGVMVDAAVRAGARGIVSAATGAGRPTPAEEAALERCAREQGVVVCLASRVGSGRVGRSAQSRERGFVAADDLPPWKARLLLALALTRTRDADEIQRFFDTH